jgi:hypothetical protein
MAFLQFVLNQSRIVAIEPLPLASTTPIIAVTHMHGSFWIRRVMAEIPGRLLPEIKREYLCK